LILCPNSLKWRVPAGKSGINIGLEQAEKMTRARNQLVSLEDTTYYHCISRCVRRAYLCGEDAETGQNFEHRKVWLVERMKQLAATFSIDICAYAVMSNHYHLVLHVDEERARAWSDKQVSERWSRLFHRNSLYVELLEKNLSSRAARKQYRQTIDLWRNRLSDISWFMRCLNESIARQANKEDNCKGRFWEGRFKSQALLDEKALLTCLAYVDLNPVRSGLSSCLEDSDFTSIQERLVHHAKRVKSKNSTQKKLLRHYGHYFEANQILSGKKAKLFNLNSGVDVKSGSAIEFNQQDYLALLELTSIRICSERDHKFQSSAQSVETSKILQKLGVSETNWIDGVLHFHKHFFQAAGAPVSLQAYQAKRASMALLKHREKWIKGIRASTRLYGT